MADEIRVRLIFDPFGICRTPGSRVANVASEKRAFQDIDELLRRDERFDTVNPRTYIIEAHCWEHFRSYWSVRGVAIERLSPRQQIAQQLRASPPDWLTDGLLHSWDIHKKHLLPPPPGFRWEPLVAEWFIEGIGGITSLVAWLRALSAAESFPADALPTVRSWLVEQFMELAAGSISGDTLNHLKAELREAQSIAACVRNWVRVTALLPLLRHGTDKVLRSAGLPAISPTAIVLAKSLPLVFPLPEPLHKEVSEQFRFALQQARRNEPQRLPDAVLALNALWDRCPEELETWLETYPQALTQEASRHLAGLPGFELNAAAARIVELYTPPQPVAAWPGLDDHFDSWISSYSRYIRQCFIRRVLPGREEDPAREFGRWLKAHPTVSFAHEVRGYPNVSRSVIRALSAGRRVILAVIDALAVHTAPEAVAYLSDALSATPSRTGHVFAPLPTITEVCKEAIISGRFPSECRGTLAAALQEVYGLRLEEILLASNWEDAERLQIQPGTRLLVYRDNRLDDRLKTAGNYRAVLEECVTIFPRIARLVARWAEDFVSYSRVSPLLLLTGDHGFTYGPKPCPSVPGAIVPEGHSRCVELPDRTTNLPPPDESVTLIDKQVFRLRCSYLAARGRVFGEAANSSWVMSHGGLLPEEVVVPIVEWFGDEAVIPWPEVTFPDGVERDFDGWVLPVLVRNGHTITITGGTVRLAFTGESGTQKELPRLDPGKEVKLVFALKGADLPEEQQVPIDVTLTIRYPGTAREATDTKQYLVPRHRKLVERTAEQAAFEDMF